jgi:hypothetical protein
VETRPSAIAGRGLFAVRDLAGATVVLRLARATVAGGRVDLLGAGFPNHGCDAVLGWADDRALATMGEVAAGTELVADYAMSISEPGWYLRCHCPSYRCRQMVEGGDWQIPQLQRRYAGWWAPPVRRLIEAGRAET